MFISSCILLTKTRCVTRHYTANMFLINLEKRVNDELISRSVSCDHFNLNFGSVFSHSVLKQSDVILIPREPCGCV